MSDDPTFAIRRIYIKDLSFEAPEAPGTFTHPWNPELSVDVDAGNEVLAEGVYEVVLTLTVTAQNAGGTAFLVEVLQGGIFQCGGFSDEDLHRVLNTVCPNILYPYAREAIDNVVMKGSFPALMIEPVNFDALYAGAMAQDD
ncbi:MAG: protein-export chaperone SecB [Alphaproteobacteria bacterium]|nr:MAG: protein-export chaperone SecB [Alphaproteobacteria bacterium]